MLRRCSAALVSRCAVLGGAFDPPTTGHVACIQQVLASEKVDKVVVVPCGAREDKGSMSPKLDRYTMTNLAVSECFPGNPNVTVSDIEVHGPGGLATYDLLQELTVKHPDTQFSFMIGSDWLENSYGISEWVSRDGKTGDKLLHEYDFLVIPRHGYVTDGALQKFGPRFSWVSHTATESVNISSTEIRENIASGNYAGVEAYLPTSVLAYLRTHRLYTQHASL